MCSPSCLSVPPTPRSIRGPSPPMWPLGFTVLYLVFCTTKSEWLLRATSPRRPSSRYSGASGATMRRSPAPPTGCQSQPARPSISYAVSRPNGRGQSRPSSAACRLAAYPSTETSAALACRDWPTAVWRLHPQWADRHTLARVPQLSFILTIQGGRTDHDLLVGHGRPCLVKPSGSTRYRVWRTTPGDKRRPTILATGKATRSTTNLTSARMSQVALETLLRFLGHARRPAGLVRQHRRGRSWIKPRPRHGRDGFIKAQIGQAIYFQGPEMEEDFEKAWGHGRVTSVVCRDVFRSTRLSRHHSI